jgi:ferredoxin-NADP reductase
LTPKNSTPVQVINIKNWADKLIYIRTNRPKNFIFTPGQFARISTKKVADSEQKNLVWRAQSLTSGPMDEFLEFFYSVGK